MSKIKSLPIFFERDGESILATTPDGARGVFKTYQAARTWRGRRCRELSKQAGVRPFDQFPDEFDLDALSKLILLGAPIPIWAASAIAADRLGLDVSEAVSRFRSAYASANDLFDRG